MIGIIILCVITAVPVLFFIFVLIATILDIIDKGRFNDVDIVSVMLFGTGFLCIICIYFTMNTIDNYNKEREEKVKIEQVR
jgi:hypothetical protein